MDNYGDQFAVRAQDNLNIAQLVRDAHNGAGLSRLRSSDVFDKVTDKVGDKVTDKVGDKVTDKVGDKVGVPQNRLFTRMPRTLSGPWSSRPSVALSSFWRLSLAFLRKDSSLMSLPTLPWP